MPKNGKRRVASVEEDDTDEPIPFISLEKRRKTLQYSKHVDNDISTTQRIKFTNPPVVVTYNQHTNKVLVWYTLHHGVEEASLEVSEHDAKMAIITYKWPTGMISVKDLVANEMQDAANDDDKMANVFAERIACQNALQDQQSNDSQLTCRIELRLPFPCVQGSVQMTLRKQNFTVLWKLNCFAQLKSEPSTASFK